MGFTLFESGALRPSVVRAEAGAGGALLAWEPAEVKVVFGAGGAGVEGGGVAGAVCVGLVGERANVVCAWPQPRGGGGVPRSGEASHRPRAWPVSLHVLVGSEKDGGDFNVPP